MPRKKQQTLLRRKTIRLAVAAALPMMMAGNAYAVPPAGTCTSSGGVVNCSGGFAGGSTGGAIMVVPTNYPVPDTENPASTINVGYSNKNDFTIGNIGSMNISVPKFSTLNIGSGTTSPTYGVAPDTSTTVVTGLKAVPGFFDIFNGGTAPAAGDTPDQQAAKLVGAKPLVNFEGVDIQQAGTANNFGIITNTSVGDNITPTSTNTFLVTNGPKVYTEGGADNLPYRTIGVWVNGDDTKLNNYGVVSVGINNAAIASSQPGVSSTMYQTSGGTAFSESFCNATDVTNSGSTACYNKPVGTIKTLVIGTNKPTVYGVLATSDGDDFQENVRINNYNKIGAYNFTTGSYATVVGVEVKENIIDTHILNAAGAVIEGVSSQLSAAGVRTASGANGATSTYATASGGVQAIGTDNNAYQLYVDNYGTIQSTNVMGNIFGTAIGSSTGEMYLTNYEGANIKGDITVGSSENKFVFTNAGTLTGSIKITPDSSSLTPVLQSGSYVDVSTPGTTVNQIVISPVINKGNLGGTLGNTVNEIGQITGGIYVASGTGKHPFELDVQPLVASGVTLKTGDTYQYAAYNIAIQSGANETTYTNGVANAASAIGAGNIKLINSALVHWEFVTNTTNQIAATVANASSIAGLSGNGQIALNNLLGAGNGAGNGAGSIVQNIASADDVRTAGEQLRPEVNNANVEAAIGVTDRVFGLVDAHLNETHLAQLTGKSGIATGEQASGTGVWLQGFGGRGDQDRRNNVDGYTADAYGFAAGADTLVGTGTRVGAALSYGQSNIEDKSVNLGNKSNIDSYQGTLYGSMLMDGWYLNGTLGLGKHNYVSKRVVLGNVVSGSHDAWQYTARVDAGLPFKVGTATLTPIASLTYSHLNQDGYTETGIGALVIGSNDTDSFRSGLGAKALIPLTDGEVKTALELRAIWNHEFGDTAQDTTANFVGGGSTFTTSGVSVARDGLNLGGSLVLAHSDADVQQNLLLSYDAEIRDQYLSHTAKLQARFDF